MSEGSDEFGLDPWAWLHEIDDAENPDLSGFRVVAAILPTGGDQLRAREAIQAQTAAVAEIITELSPETEGDWIWVLPDDTQPKPEALATLLQRVLKQREAAVLGALLIEPRRHGAGKMVSDWAQTISTNGRMRTLTDPGELYQGQLTAIPALGVPAAGMLVRGDVWRFLGGFNAKLPRDYWGLDFGWRANLTGYLVIAEPEAQLTTYAGFDDPSDDRAAGLALTVANTPSGLRWLVSARLALVTAVIGVGYLLGKDFGRSGEEFRGLWRWLRNRELRRTLAGQLAALPVKPTTLAQTSGLRPARGSGISRAAALTMARFAGWLETFSGRGTAVSFDEMTGDDFAEVGRTQSKVPLAAAAGAALLVGSLVASRNSYGVGLLAGPQLLASPEGWTNLVNSYLAPAAGSAGAGAPWAALLGVFSLATFGHPDWLVTILMVGAVPLSWLLAFRVLRQVVADRYLAGAGALAYALAPALVGGLNAANLGATLTAILLPVLAYSLRHWLSGTGWSWRSSGAVAFWLMLLCALVPLFWVPALIAAVITGWRARNSKVWLQWGMVLLAPMLMLVGPWGGILLRYPGRLLTGIEPTLAPSEVVPGWLLVFGHPSDSAAPVWLSVAFFAVCWLAALAGAWRRPTLSVAALSAGVGAVAVAVVITRLAVYVPPGAWVRPQAMEWLILVVAALVLAAVGGLDGVTKELADRALGLSHIASLGTAVVAAASLLVGIGWWVVAGQSGLTRGPVSTVPAFVANAQVSATPGRTLALAAGDGRVRWSLLEGDFSRLGDSERGLAFGGDPAARALAASVVTRLIADSADEQILPDLVRLGVANVTLSGGEAAQRISINNTPGLGLGTGTDAQFVWPVPDSAIAVISTAGERTITGSGQPIPAGGGGAVLQLAQPPDSRWVVSVGGAELVAVSGEEPGLRYDLAEVSGTLEYELTDGSPWWAWTQLAGLVLLGMLTAPSVRRRMPVAPRRIAGGEQ